MSKGNPLSNHSIQVSREIYASIGLCYECGTKAATCRHAAERSAAATCSICALAPAMRVCGVCQFQQPIVLFVASDVSTNNIVAQTAASVSILDDHAC